jgi:hypothetical protein
MKNLSLKLYFLSLTIFLITGCGQSEEDLRIIKRRNIISQLNLADSQLVQGRNNLNNLLRKKDSEDLRNVLKQIDDGIDTLQKVEREL